MRNSRFDKSYYTSGSYGDYLLSFKSLGEELAEDILRQVVEPGMKVLDVGCGMGGAVWAFRKRGMEAYGTEVSDFCLDHSPVKKYLVKAQAGKLPFNAKQFDLVICKEVLYYLSYEQIRAAVKELARVTKKYLYLEVITKYSVNSRQTVNPDNLRERKNLLTKHQWLKLMAEAGFRFYKRVYPLKDDPDLNGLFIKSQLEI